MSDERPDRTPGARPAVRRWLVFGGAVLILAPALVLATRQGPVPVTDEAPRSAASIAAPAPEPASAAVDDPQALAAADAEPEGGAAPQVLTDAPGFDIVRVAPDGGAVVAGHAAPGATVTIYADATPLAEVEADGQGNFVAIFRAEPAAVPQALTLGAVEAGGAEIVSEEVVVLLPETPAPAPEATATADATAAEPELEAGVAETVALVPAETTPQAAEAPDRQELAAVAPTVLAAEPAPVAEASARLEAEVEAPAAETPAAQTLAAEAAQTAPGESGELGPRPRVAATAILRSDGVEVVGGPAAVSTRQVSLASISYAADGDVVLAGLGAAGALLRAYVDDGFAEEGQVGGDGRWTLGLGGVDAGLYRLRIDQMDGEGQVASRVETPFQRDVPRAPMPRPGQPEGERATQVTVQPGTNLWTLARVHYGAGVLYTQIFTANQHLIRDPHLIYPGQIFDLPEVEADR